MAWDNIVLLQNLLEYCSHPKCEFVYVGANESPRGMTGM